MRLPAKLYLKLVAALWLGGLLLTELTVLREATLLDRRGQHVSADPLAVGFIVLYWALVLLVMWLARRPSPALWAGVQLLLGATVVLCFEGILWCVLRNGGPTVTTLGRVLLFAALVGCVLGLRKSQAGRRAFSLAPDGGDARGAAAARMPWRLRMELVVFAAFSLLLHAELTAISARPSTKALTGGVLVPRLHRVRPQHIRDWPRLRREVEVGVQPLMAVVGSSLCALGVVAPLLARKRTLVQWVALQLLFGAWSVLLAGVAVAMLSGIPSGWRVARLAVGVPLALSFLYIRWSPQARWFYRGLELEQGEKHRPRGLSVALAVSVVVALLALAGLLGGWLTRSWSPWAGEPEASTWALALGVPWLGFGLVAAVLAGQPARWRWLSAQAFLAVTSVWALGTVVGSIAGEPSGVAALLFAAGSLVPASRLAYVRWSGPVRSYYRVRPAAGTLRVWLLGRDRADEVTGPARGRPVPSGRVEFARRALLCVAGVAFLGALLHTPWRCWLPGSRSYGSSLAYSLLIAPPVRVVGERAGTVVPDVERLALQCTAVVAAAALGVLFLGWPEEAEDAGSGPAGRPGVSSTGSRGS